LNVSEVPGSEGPPDHPATLEGISYLISRQLCAATNVKGAQHRATALSRKKSQAQPYKYGVEIAKFFVVIHGHPQVCCGNSQ
jgi:hypothetical protein